MTGEPRLLDLCCGIGGACVGYQRAGFDVTGVDRLAMPDYPGRFVHGDAIAYLDRYGSTFDAIHASPPCLPHSSLTAGTNRGLRYEDALAAILTRLRRSQRLAVVENVVGAPLWLHRDLVLCGESFGLDVIRHRVFELIGWTTPQPSHVAHRGAVGGYRHGKHIEGPYVAVYGNGGGKGSVERWRSAMGIDWTNDRHGIAQAIPPVYTEWIGARLMDELKGAAA